jgi:manganese/zinc/iron transport system substrate-binding protein
MIKNMIQVGALSAGVLALSSCGKKVSLWQDESKVNVVATTTMIDDLVKVIGGDKVEVMGMMKPGIDPHGYEQTAQDVAFMNTADVVFYNGLHLEIHMQPGLEKRTEKGDSVYAVTKTITADELIQPQDDSEEYADPHVWGDPELWTKTMDVVEEGLS